MRVLLEKNYNNNDNNKIKNAFFSLFYDIWVMNIRVTTVPITLDKVHINEYEAPLENYTFWDMKEDDALERLDIIDIMKSQNEGINGNFKFVQISSFCSTKRYS